MKSSFDFLVCGFLATVTHSIDLHPITKFKNNFVNVLKSLRVLFRRLPNNFLIQELYERFDKRRPPDVSNKRLQILVQCAGDPYYFGLFATVCNALRLHAATSVDLFVLQSVNAGMGVGLRAFLLRMPPLNYLIANQWIRAYRVLADRVGYSSVSWRHPVGDAVDLWQSWRSWKNIRDRKEIGDVLIDGIECGDLIGDTFLRFRPSPRIDVDDAFLLYLIWQAHRDVRRADWYFKSVRPQLYLTSYTTYIQHGIAARVALREGVRVISFGNLQEIGKTLSVEDPYQTRNSLNYRKDFLKLDRKEERLDWARKQLDARLSGGIDGATAYMAVSAYMKSEVVVPDVEGAVVVFLHDFYDSPHVYADFVFSDFWAWSCFIFETLQSAGIRFLVKPHPNQIALSARVIAELSTKFPAIEWIPSGVTNRQLAEAGMVCAVTAYGTVAHEVAYLGVPSIACARHPHVAYDFCRTAYSKEAYAELLKRADQMAFSDRAAMREQVLEFYVMHNLCLPDDEAKVRDQMIALWRDCAAGSNADGDAIAQQLQEISIAPGFQKFIGNIASTC